MHRNTQTIEERGQQIAKKYVERDRMIDRIRELSGRRVERGGMDQRRPARVKESRKKVGEREA